MRSFRTNNNISNMEEQDNLAATSGDVTMEVRVEFKDKNGRVLSSTTKKETVPHTDSIDLGSEIGFMGTFAPLEEKALKAFREAQHESVEDYLGVGAKKKQNPDP